MNLSSTECPSEALIESMLKTLEENQNYKPNEPEKRLLFKKSKQKVINLLTENPNLLKEDQRLHALKILSRTVRSRAYQDLKNIPIKPISLLFHSPKLWKIIFKKEDHPEDFKFLQSLSKETLTILLNTENTDKDLLDFETIHITEAAIAARKLGLQEVESLYIAELSKNRINCPQDLNIKELYLLASVPNLLSGEQFLKFKKKSSISFILPDLETVKKEFGLFNEIGVTRGSWEELCSKSLFRLFLFIDSESSPSEEKLHQIILEQLLGILKSGDLSQEHAECLIKTCKRKIHLQNLLKKDTASLFLEGIDEPIKLSFWPLFAASGYFAKSIRFEPTFKLKDVSASTFFILYNWIKCGEIDFSCVSPEQLIGLLHGANYFQLRNFEKIKKEIEGRILQTSDNSAESLTNLVGLSNQFSCTSFKEHVISHLSKCYNFLSINKALGKNKPYEVEIQIKKPIPLISLHEAIQILKSFQSKDLSIRLLIETSILPLLCSIYIAKELDLEGKEALEKSFFQNYPLPSHKKLMSINSSPQWDPLCVLEILSGCGSQIYSHTSKLFQRCPLVTYVKNIEKCLSPDFNTLKDEVDLFKRFLNNDDQNEQNKLLAQMGSKTLIRFSFLLNMLKEHSSTKNQMIQKAFNTVIERFENLLKENKKAVVRDILEKYSLCCPEELKNLKIKINIENMGSDTYALFLPFSLFSHGNLDTQLLDDKIKTSLKKEHLTWVVEILVALKQVDDVAFKDALATVDSIDYFHAFEWMYDQLYKTNVILSHFTAKLNSFLANSSAASSKIHHIILSWAASSKKEVLLNTYFKKQRDCGFSFRNGNIFYSVSDFNEYTSKILDALRDQIFQLQISDNTRNFLDLLDKIKGLNLNEVILDITQTTDFSKIAFDSFASSKKLTLNMDSATDFSFVSLTNNLSFMHLFTNTSFQVVLNIKDTTKCDLNYWKTHLKKTAGNKLQF